VRQPSRVFPLSSGDTGEAILERVLRSVWVRLVAGAPALVILALFGLHHGQLPRLGEIRWIEGIRPETGLAWTADLGDPGLDEDGHEIDAALFEWLPGADPGLAAGACGWAGPVFGEQPAGVCARYWRQYGPAHQLHDAIRSRGGGGFSVWHGILYFSVPEGGDPRGPDRHLALWIPRRGAALRVAVVAALVSIWAAWPLGLALARRRPRLLLVGLGLAAADAATGAGVGTLAGAGLLLAALQLLPQIRHARRRRSRLSAGLLALAGFLGAEAGVAIGYTSLGLVPDLQIMPMMKYLAELRSDRPIVLLVGSSYSQYGIDEAGLETALDAAGHPVTVARLGYGGLSIPERLHYIRLYLARAQQKPAAVLFEVSAYYDLLPLKQLEQNLFSRREIAAMDADNLRLSLGWALGPEGDPNRRTRLTAELLGHFALNALRVGSLPGSTRWATVPAKSYRGTPPKTAHFTDAAIAEDLAAGQSNETLSAELLIPGVPVVLPTEWTRRAIAEEIGLFRAAGVTRFGFYAPPSRFADEPIYARQFCRIMTEYPCMPAEDPDLLAALGHDEDWLDTTHLQGPGRQLYTEWLARRLAANAVLP
jgi:hypothetical protein